MESLSIHLDIDRYSLPLFTPVWETTNFSPSLIPVMDPLSLQYLLHTGSKHLHPVAVQYQPPHLGVVGLIVTIFSCEEWRSLFMLRRLALEEVK